MGWFILLPQTGHGNDSCENVNTGNERHGITGYIR